MPDKIGSLIKNTLLIDVQHELFTCMQCLSILLHLIKSCSKTKNETQFHINIVVYKYFYEIYDNKKK